METQGITFYNRYTGQMEQEKVLGEGALRWVYGTPLGKLSLHLGEKVYQVRAGESFYYRAEQTHRISNPGNRPARLIWISSPPEF